MNHTPTLTADVYRCACGFYAVNTTKGIHVINPGTDRQLHIDRITQVQIERNAHVERMMTRLRKQYAEQAEFGGYRLSLRQLQRLYKFIVAEYMP